MVLQKMTYQRGILQKTAFTKENLQKMAVTKDFKVQKIKYQGCRKSGALFSPQTPRGSSYAYVSASISVSNVRCFPGGSEEFLCGDMDAVGVLAICLRRRAVSLCRGLKWGQKVRQHFLRKVFRVCGHFMCLTCPVLFLEGTSAGCFAPISNKNNSPFFPATSYCKTSYSIHTFLP